MKIKSLFLLFLLLVVAGGAFFLDTHEVPAPVRQIEERINHTRFFK